MRFSAFTTLFLATFSAAAPLNLPFETDEMSFEHVPDENKRQEVESMINIMASNLHNAFPDDIQDEDAFNKVMMDFQNMVATVLTDSNEILNASGIQLESYMTENELLNAFDHTITEKRMFSAVAKKIVIKLLKAMIKNLFRSVLDISKDAGVEIEKLWAEAEFLRFE